MDQCAECGFRYDLSTAAQAGNHIRGDVAALARLLTNTDRQALIERTISDRWSALEYGCHVRDVMLVQRERVLLARRAETPSVEPMGREERVTHDAYREQDPIDVADELTMAARLLTNVFDRLTSEDWELRLVYNWPDASERTLRWVAVHTLHDVHHHLLDVQRQLY
ncbi:MAG: DinB family protein [Mycobacterium sp.]